MAKEISAKLQSLLDKLSNPDAIARVRLTRQTKAQYEREYPNAAKGKAQAAATNQVKAAKRGVVTPNSGVTPFAEWLSEQLNLGMSTVRDLIKRADYIPEEALRHIEHLGKISSIGGLLTDVATALRKDPNADWLQMIERQVNPVIPQGGEKPGGAFMGPNAMFFGLDSKAPLMRDIELAKLYDAIIIDPPYGMKHKGRVNGPMIDDDKGSLWSVPLLAKLLKPGRPLCLWCNKGTLGKWSMTLLDEGLTIWQLVRWDKGRIAYTRRYEYMLVAGTGSPVMGPRVLEEPRVPDNAPERKYHDTPKPVALMEKVLRGWTHQGDLILDCFAGTASVARAAMRTDRKCVAFEISDDIAVFAASLLRDERSKLQRELQTAALTKRAPMVPIGSAEADRAAWAEIDASYVEQTARMKPRKSPS